MIGEIETNFEELPRKLEKEIYQNCCIILKGLSRNLVDLKKKKTADRFRGSFVETLGLVLGHFFDKYFREIA